MTPPAPRFTAAQLRTLAEYFQDETYVAGAGEYWPVGQAMEQAADTLEGIEKFQVEVAAYRLIALQISESGHASAERALERVAVYDVVLAELARLVPQAETKES